MGLLSRRAFIALATALSMPRWARGQQLWRSAADMVAKILRGTKAGDIPMEQPTTYELAINAATARKLGIRIPESIRVRIDRVIDHQKP